MHTIQDKNELTRAGRVVRMFERPAARRGPHSRSLHLRAWGWFPSRHCLQNRPASSSQRRGERIVKIVATRAIPSPGRRVVTANSVGAPVEVWQTPRATARLPRRTRESTAPAERRRPQPGRRRRPLRRRYGVQAVASRPAAHRAVPAAGVFRRPPAIWTPSSG
eukprot:2093548-Prymnesium_polylepis.1